MNNNYISGSTVPPALPTFKRYRRLFGGKRDFSITRELQYEMFRKEPGKGKVLDFGGGNRADYLNLLQCDVYESVNIDAEMEPTWVTKVGERLPCPRGHYDTVISLNTIEHVFAPRPLIEEFYDALKPGGDFVCSIPFLFPIHAHPDDFFRPTSSWWKLSLGAAGFENIRIYPLLWGPFSTGVVCSGTPGPFKRVRIRSALIIDILYARLRFMKDVKEYSGSVGLNFHNHALSFFVKARKP